MEADVRRDGAQQVVGAGGLPHHPHLLGELGELAVAHPLDRLQKLNRSSVSRTGISTCSPGAIRSRRRARSAPTRSSSSTIRKRTALDWAAIAVEEHGRELAQSFVDAAKRGDWRAAEALMNRIYGKPEQAVVAQVAASPAVEVIRGMSLDEKLELLRRLQDGEFVSAASALPVVEPAPARE